MTKESKIDLVHSKITQIGFIFKDIKKHAKLWEELFGVPKFSVLPPHTIKYFYKEKENDVTVTQAFSRGFNTQLEFVQHIKGESYHQDFLKQGREGLHHISIFVKNIEDSIEKLKAAGIKQLSGGQRGRQAFAHFDTEDTLGVILEIQETKKRKRKNSR